MVLNSPPTKANQINKKMPQLTGKQNTYSPLIKVPKSVCEGRPSSKCICGNSKVLSDTVCVDCMRILHPNSGY